MKSYTHLHLAYSKKASIFFSLQKLHFPLYLQFVNRNDFELERSDHA